MNDRFDPAQLEDEVTCAVNMGRVIREHEADRAKQNVIELGEEDMLEVHDDGAGSEALAVLNELAEECGVHPFAFEGRDAGDAFTNEAPTTPSLELISADSGVPCRDLSGSDPSSFR